MLDYVFTVAIIGLFGINIYYMFHAKKTYLRNNDVLAKCNKRYEKEHQEYIERMIEKDAHVVQLERLLLTDAAPIALLVHNGGIQMINQRQIEAMASSTSKQEMQTLNEDKPSTPAVFTPSNI